MKTKVITALGVGLLAAGLQGVGPSFAQTPWQEHHPGRVEINHRLRNEYRRIGVGFHDHDLTRAEGQQLRSEDRSIYRQERIDAAGDHGHLTRAEDRRLNHEENAVSAQIRADDRAGR